VGIAVVMFTGNTEVNTAKTQTEGTRLSGTVLEINSEEILFDGPTRIVIADMSGKEHTIAVPSMGINLCVASSSISSVAHITPGDQISVSGERDEDGTIVPCNGSTDMLEVYSIVEESEYGYTFVYRKGPDGYISVPIPESDNSDFLAGRTLFNEKEYQELIASTDAREAPPSMQVRVYQNQNKESASVWASRHPAESNSELALAPFSETVISGANAVFYVVDGLYPTDTYVVAHGEHIYVLSGSYLDRQSQLYVDFQSLVDSFVFIPYAGAPGTAPHAKIDVGTVCRNALASMTFATAEEAEAFVEACINGEHPEVLEAYVESLGLDGAVI